MNPDGKLSLNEAWKLNARFCAFIPLILAHEEEFNRDGSVHTEHDPDDPGGTTKFGIDQRSHPKVNIAGLTEEDATEIYFDEWTKAPCDELPLPLGEMIFDIMVNGGPAILWLQQALTSTGDSGVVADGFCGPKTIAAAGALDVARLRQVAALIYQDRTARFERLAQKPGFAKYRRGWLARNQDLKNWAFAHFPAQA